MLLAIRAFVEAGRALAGWAALELDRSLRHPNAAERAKSESRVAVLTPVIKAGFTDFGFESAVLAQQVFGGHGYIRESGVEQFVRDTRIGQIYEGTNGVQAMDLVGRKLSLNGGAAVDDLLTLMGAELDVAAHKPGTTKIVTRVREALVMLGQASGSLRRADAERRSAVAVDYLRLFGLVAMGWMWARMVAVATGDSPLHAAKRDVADFFVDRLLSQSSSLAASIAAGESSTMTLSVNAF
jgi:hypothetical protein